MRESDEPDVPHDLHHWLAKVEQEVAALRAGQAAIIHDVNELRVAQARAGQPNWGIIASLLGVFLAISVQTAYAVYWGGGINARLDTSLTQIAHYGAMVDDHIRTAGPFRESAGRLSTSIDELDRRMRNCSERQAVVIQRLDAIDARNRIADSNWEILKRKGVLVESTK